LFSLLLSACNSTPPEPPASPPQRLFLQQVTSSSAIVKWRGEARQACIGKELRALRNPGRAQCEAARGTAGNHQEARFNGLDADTTYYYSVGGLAARGQQIRTAPVTGSLPADGNTRIWLIGDSGTASERDLRSGAAKHPGEAAAVYTGYKAYTAASGNEATDLFLLLGDNAYNEGTDAQWQEALFEVYPDLLKNTPTWPTIGNHEMGAGRMDICVFAKLPQCEQGPVMMHMGGVSVASEPAAYDGNRDGQPDGTGMPYLDIFSLPTKGEAGGVPSGTEQYYSFDYGNVHVISLDSQLSARDDAQRAAMRHWLSANLRANMQDWTIVIFHHPPYSKGANHDSDNIENNPIDRPQYDMRQEFTPLFEAHGVDVVYSGHSHSYERSYYLRGHTGTSESFSYAAHTELIDGDPERPSPGQGGNTYAQLSQTSGAIDDRVVYTVAGNSGKADHDSGLTDAAVWLRHPAHIQQDADPEGRRGLSVTGSVVIDATATELTARFIDDKGEQLDYFTITR
jgi:hypothetical protein